MQNKLNPIVILTIALISMQAACSTEARQSSFQSPVNASSDMNEQTAWARWVRDHADPILSVRMMDDKFQDLEAIKNEIGSRSIVGLGEHDHELHETPTFRNRLFKFLVTRMGFRAIILESGVIEGRLVERYVQGDPKITLKEVLHKGFTHNMGPWEETGELVAWMRRYNDSQKDPLLKVHYFGLDLPVVGDAPILPLQELSSYLSKVDAKLRNSFSFKTTLALAGKAYRVTAQARYAWKTVAYKKAKQEAVKLKEPAPDLDTWELDPDDLDAYSSIGFDQLSRDEQFSMERGIGRLAKEFSAEKVAYVKRSSADEYAWNARLVEVARQHLRNLRSRQRFHKLGDLPRVVDLLKQGGILDGLIIDMTRKIDPSSREDWIAYFKGRRSRERMAAENVQWAQKQFGKTLVYAHNGHIVKAPVSIQIGEVDVGTGADISQGEVTAELYGDDYFVIGATAGDRVDRDGSIDPKVEDARTCSDCIEKAFFGIENKVAVGFFLSLNALTGAAQDYLAQERAIRWQAGFQRLHVPQGLDAIVLLKKISSGSPLKPSR